MSQTSESERSHAKRCDCGNGEFYFCKDLNLDKAWKAGNMFCRICTECGNRYFLSQAMYQAASDQYVILDGEDEPIPVFECPACDEQVTGQPDTCPYCDVEYQWGEDSSDSEEAESESESDQEADDTEQVEDDRTPDSDSDSEPQETTA